jgi:hypothetical protein
MTEGRRDGSDPGAANCPFGSAAALATGAEKVFGGTCRERPSAITAGLPDLHRIASGFGNDIPEAIRGRMIAMSARVPCSIGSIAFLLALSAPLLVAGPLAGSAAAADCLSEPNSAAPANSHWYYRIDRMTQRKCWYLRAADAAPDQAPVKDAHAAPAASAHSVGDAKSVVAQRRTAKLSSADVDKLYADFLEWRRNPGNGLKGGR